MFDKIAKMIGKLSPMIWTVVAIVIVLAVFVICLLMSLGGDLGKFKAAARKALSSPSFEVFQATARELPTRARKQYKRARKTGEKPSDVITVDACVYSPFQASAAAHLPGAVMTAGVLAILFTFFAITFSKGIEDSESAVMAAPLTVTAVVMLLRLAAGLISSAILKRGVAVYDKYIAKLDECMQSSHEQAPAVDIPFVRADEQPDAEQQPFVQADYAPTYDATFGEPDKLNFEVEEETAAEPVAEPQVESEEDFKARARREAMEKARAQQAAQREEARKAAAHQAAQQAAARQAARNSAPNAAQQPADAATSGSADEVVARIEKISKEGAPLATMKEVALQLQKERSKPENKTPEQQRKLNEALATLLKAMSAANRK